MNDDDLLWGLLLVWAARNLLDGNVTTAVSEYMEPKSAPPGYRPDIPVAPNETRLETRRRVYDQVHDIAVRAGFPNAKLATAVALAESGGNPGAELHTPREWSIGLWQININAHQRYSKPQLLNPDANARAAVQISKSGTDWTPWSAYNSGRYLKFMERP